MYGSQQNMRHPVLFECVKSCPSVVIAGTRVSVYGLLVLGQVVWKYLFKDNKKIVLQVILLNSVDVC